MEEGKKNFGEGKEIDEFMFFLVLDLIGFDSM